jgi:transposase-like protein
VSADLKRIYQASTLEEAELELDGFNQSWKQIYPIIALTVR